MADVEIVQGEFGDNYDFTIYSEQTAALANLTNFTTFTLKIKSTDEVTTHLTKSLSLVSGSTSVLRWAIASADTASIPVGVHLAQIIMVDEAVTIRRKTEHLSVRVVSKLD